MDKIDIHIKNISFIVSVASLKPLSNDTLDKEFALIVPPLEPVDKNTYTQFLIFLEFLMYLYYLIITMQIIAYIQNVFLDGRSH